MFWYMFADHQIRDRISRTIQWAVCLLIADGHFNLPQHLCGYVWVNIPLLTISSGATPEKGVLNRSTSLIVTPGSFSWFIYLYIHLSKEEQTTHTRRNSLNRE